MLAPRFARSPTNGRRYELLANAIRHGYITNGQPSISLGWRRFVPANKNPRFSPGVFVQHISRSAKCTNRLGRVWALFDVVDRRTQHNSVFGKTGRVAWHLLLPIMPADYLDRTKRFESTFIA